MVTFIIICVLDIHLLVLRKIDQKFLVKEQYKC